MNCSRGRDADPKPGVQTSSYANRLSGPRRAARFSTILPGHWGRCIRALGRREASGHEKLFVQGRHATPFEGERAEHWAWSPQWRLQGGVLVAPWRACTDARLVEKKQCPDSLSAVARASSSASDGEKREMAWKRERFVDFSGTDVILYPSDTCRLDFRTLERQGVSRIPPMKMSNFSWRPLTQHFPTSFVSYGQI